MRTRPYEKLIAWQEAFKVCTWIYELTKQFPPEEKFGLTSQMRRAAYSVPMNIAEGNAKRSQKEQTHFLETAIASLEELHCQCLLTHELKYITAENLHKTDDHIQRVGYLIAKLRASLCSPKTPTSSYSVLSSGSSEPVLSSGSSGSSESSESSQ